MKKIANAVGMANAQGPMRSPLGVPKKFSLPDMTKNPVMESKQNMNEALQGLADFKQIFEPPKIEKRAELSSNIQIFEHQKRPLDKFFQNDGNILVAHGVGSGKTLTGIHIAEEAKKKGLSKSTLVVVPASLRNNFLENGIQKFTNSTGVIYGNKQEQAKGTHASITNVPKNTDYHIVSSELFRKNPEAWVKATKADTVLYDELHRAKDDHGLTHDAIKKVRSMHRNFIGLTGSFISNNPSDIVPLIDAMTDGKHPFGSKREFERSFIGLDDKGNKTLKYPEKLAKLVAPYLDYFGTDQMKASDIPKKRLEEVFVEMSPQQHELFNYAIGKIEPGVLNKLKEDIHSLSEKEVGHIFSKIIHARKVSNSIHTLDDRVTPEDSSYKTPKVARMLRDVEQHLKETPDGQVVLYTNLIHGGVDVLKAGLAKRGIPHGIFIGKKEGVTEETRQKDVDDFRAGKKKVIVVSSAGAEGLSLPNTTFFGALDGHFNPERILQAEARGVRAGGLAHRPQDDRNVLVKRYVTVSPRGSQTSSMGFWDMLMSMFRSSQKKKDVLDVPSVDQWIYDIAAKKHYLNDSLRQELKKVGSELALTPPKSVREEYWDRFGHTLQHDGAMKSRKITEPEKLFLSQVRNAARASVLNESLQELMQEALSMHPGDPRLLMILSLIFHRKHMLTGIDEHQARKMIGMSDTALRSLIRGDLSPMKLDSVEDGIKGMMHGTPSLYPEDDDVNE